MSDRTVVIPPQGGPLFLMTQSAAPSENPSSEKERQATAPYRPALDLIRFLAAIWVMLSHASLVKGGGQAVALFFVLSGYLIGGQLINEKLGKGTIDTSAFYFKRITRIWVPYFIVLAGMILLFVARGQASGQAFFERMLGALTYTYNLVNDLRGNIHPTWVSFNHIWSLSIEEQFYLVSPLFIVCLPNRSILPVCILSTIFFMLVAPLYAGLVVGVLLAASLKWVGAENRMLKPSLPLIGAFVGACVLVFAVGQTDISAMSWISYLVSGFVVLVGIFLPMPRRLHETLRCLGLMTYSYYLIHGLPGYFCGALYRNVSGAAAVPIWVNVMFGLLALPLSYLFVCWIELPTLSIRNRMLKAKSPWVRIAPWMAWGLTLIGLSGLLLFSFN